MHKSRSTQEISPTRQTSHIKLEISLTKNLHLILLQVFKKKLFFVFATQKCKKRDPLRKLFQFPSQNVNEANGSISFPKLHFFYVRTVLDSKEKNSISRSFLGQTFPASKIKKLNFKSKPNATDDGESLVYFEYKFLIYSLYWLIYYTMSGFSEPLTVR